MVAKRTRKSGNAETGKKSQDDSTKVKPMDELDRFIRNCRIDYPRMSCREIAELAKEAGFKGPSGKVLAASTIHRRIKKFKRFKWHQMVRDDLRGLSSKLVASYSRGLDADDAAARHDLAFGLKILDKQTSVKHSGSVVGGDIGSLASAIANLTTGEIRELRRIIRGRGKQSDE